MTDDPATTLARGAMHPRQVLAIAVVIVCVAIDGFDVFAIAFASPLIAQEWNLDPAWLGLVLSMELVGMGLGAWLLGMTADRVGRRPALILALIIVATGMWAASVSADVAWLCVARLYTGLGIGGVLVASSALISESASDRRRDRAVALMVAGYPLGAAAGGMAASALLADAGRWQTIFEFGAIATAVLIVPVILLVPESIAYLVSRQPARALARINSTLSLYGRSAISKIELLPAPKNAGAPGLLVPGMAAVTFKLTTAFFMHMMTFYFLMKWIPKLAVDLGHSPASAGMALVWANLAGGAGALLVSWLTRFFSLRILVILAMAFGTVSVALFGQGMESLRALTLVAIAAGAFTTGASAAFYALLTRSFPARVRARGIGFVLGVGRAGAAAGPVTAGLMFSAGWPLGVVAAVMACGCLVAAAAVSRLDAGS